MTESEEVMSQLCIVNDTSENYYLSLSFKLISSQASGWRGIRSGVWRSVSLKRLVQYRVWKLMKMMGKATRAIRSMSLSLTPQRVVGAVRGKRELTTEGKLLIFNF